MLCRSHYIFSDAVASSFETPAFGVLLRDEVLNPHGEEARSAVSNHEADGGLTFRRAK
jgi:hypothetical protein